MAARKSAKKTNASEQNETVPLSDAARIERLERVVREMRPSAFPEPPDHYATRKDEQ